MCWPCFVTHVLASDPPERPYDFDEAAGLLKPGIWLHQYARRAAAYRVVW